MTFDTFVSDESEITKWKLKSENSRELHGWQAGPNTVTALLFGETINFKYAQPFNYYIHWACHLYTRAGILPTSLIPKSTQN